MKNNKGLRQKYVYSEKQCRSIMNAYGKKLLISIIIAEHIISLLAGVEYANAYHMVLI